jgi:hypothetical protein
MSGERDWNVFDKMPRPLSRPQLAERDRLDMLFAQTFTTPAGAEVLRHLRAVTIEQPAWVPGQDPSQGFAREGQNSIVREIERRIARATQGPPQETKRP